MHDGVAIKPIFHRLAPFHEVGRLAVGLNRRLIPIYLVQINRVRILSILEHVKPQAPWLVVHRAAGVTEHRFHKSVTVSCLDLNRDHECLHSISFASASLDSMGIARQPG
jgi:hypothetical protein